MSHTINDRRAVLGVLTPAQARRAGATRVGGKAAGLARLDEVGAVVPAWVVLPSSALARHLGQSPALAAELAGSLASLMALDAHDLNHLSDPVLLPTFQAEAAAMQRALLSSPLDAALVESITQALAALEPGPWAVRSSMVGEDSARHSFAGQLESFLGLRTPEAVVEAVQKCWASALSAHALMYRARIGHPMTDLRVAVILQQMVEGDVSGVLFTAHPGTGRRDHMLVSAAWGLAQGVVSGRCNTDEFTWDRTTQREIDARIAAKDVAITSTPHGQGTQEVAVDPARQHIRCLTPEQLQTLCDEGARQEAAFGVPLDIEWTFTADGRLVLLQARPITTTTKLPEPIPEDGPQRIFDSSNIQESFSGVTSPLTFSFVAEFYRRTFARLMPELGADAALLRACEPLLQNLIALVGGRMYYSLGAWYQGLRLLPSYAHNKASMERMMGIDVPFDDGPPPSWSEQLKTLPRALSLLAHLKLRFSGLDKEVPKFLEHVEAVFQNIDRAELKHKSFSALMATLHTLRAEVMDRWTPPILNDIHMMMSVGKLRRVVERALNLPPDLPHGDTQNSLIDAWMSTLLASPDDHLASVAPTLLLLDIAQTLRDHPACIHILTHHPNQPAQHILDSLCKHCPEITHPLHNYLDQFGDRCIGELKLETITLREDPRFLVEVLCNYVTSDHLPTLDAAHNASLTASLQRAEIETKLKHQASWRDKWRVEKVLSQARQAVRQREQMRMARTKLFGLIRDLYLALGSRLFDLGRLTHPRQIIHLTTDELDAYFEGRTVTLDLAQLAALRAADFQRFTTHPMPDRFYTRGPVYQAEQYRGTQPNTSTNTPLQGVGCYPGVVEAQVQVIHAPQDSLAINKRILVAFQTDPGWTPLLPTAAGVLIERGSTLSHVAVVARELHIPVIVNIPQLTQTLHSHDLIRMDGTSGTVQILHKKDNTPNDNAPP